jgi:hypothetical protein
MLILGVSFLVAMLKSPLRYCGIRDALFVTRIVAVFCAALAAQDEDLNSLKL